MSGPRPAARVGQGAPYAVPRAGAPLDLHLDGNEGARPPKDLLAALEDGFPDALRRYPSARALEARLAAQHGVDPAQVLVTAGGDDAIDRLCRACLEPGRRLILPSPSFEMIARYAELAGASVERVPWPDGPWPLAAVLARLDPAAAQGEPAAPAPVGLVALVTPNNPTGQTADAAALTALSAALPEGVVLLDHAYVEFADADLTALALRLPNVVVVRTLSKAFGLAGIRLGYALGPAELIRWLRVCGAPYAVSHPSLRLADRQLDQGAPTAYLAAVQTERAALAAQLRGHGLQVPEGQQANFVFARAASPARALWIRDGLAGLGIGVRAWPGHPELGAAVRITCPGDAADLARLQAALATALAPQALLFDVDGVLVDVQGSYREAIRQTCAAFGATVGAADIAAVKAAGDANNDWIVSQRLLAARGIEAPLAAVTAAFEAAYQGGLWRNERLLVPREWLAALARRWPVGLVTGRPRADLERFLEQFDLKGIFSTTVAMEDAPRKPDPAPVRLALSRLGVARAWLLGDTPDDVRAARGAGALPLGVVAPGEDPAAAGPALTAAGAARILPTATALLELLP